VEAVWKQMQRFDNVDLKSTACEFCPYWGGLSVIRQLTVNTVQIFSTFFDFRCWYDR